MAQLCPAGGADGPVGVADREGDAEVAGADEVTEAEGLSDVAEGAEVDESEGMPLDEDAVPDGEALQAVTAAQTTSVEPNQEAAEPAIGSLSSDSPAEPFALYRPSPHDLGRWAAGARPPCQCPCSSSTTGASTEPRSALAQT